MVSVVILFELPHGLFGGSAELSGQYFKVGCHLRPYFFLADAAYGGVFRQHADILNIVKLAKDAQLGEFGDAGEEDEPQVGVAGL